MKPLITRPCALVAAGTGVRKLKSRAILQGSSSQIVSRSYGRSLSIIFLTSVCLALNFLTGCGGSSATPKTTTTQTVAIAATSGSNQSAAAGAAFAAPLEATVTTNGTPTAGVTVTFTAPSSGASGAFAGSVSTATTDANGKATSVAFAANSTVGGPYTVTASAPGATSAASFKLTNTSDASTAGAPAAIAATSGSGQSAQVSTAFQNPLVATVVDSHSNPVSGVLVTFTTPASGASGGFAGGIKTATTDANGKATSAVFTANASAGPYTVAATVSGVSTPANFTLTNSTTPVETVTVTSGSGQSAVVTSAFSSPLVATVTTGGVPNSGVSVTFTAPATGASGTFGDTGNNITTATTNASGVATSALFTANTTAGGPYTVVASASGAGSSANFSLTDSNANNYVFYLSGADNFNTANPTNPTNYLALAGVVTIAPNGNVLGGEEDYNDANSTHGAGSSTNSITGGTLSVDGTGFGTLTLITNNSKIGVNGTETFAVAFVNSNHARVMQFDGTATSSGSLDLQTPSSTLSGGYSFILSGVDSSYHPAAFGGVFSITGNAITNGVVDLNDNGYSTTGISFNTSATLSPVDSFGRGTITNPFPAPTVTLAYYIVNQKAVRIVDVDTADAAIGSAFSQGNTTFTNASLGTSVLAIAGNPDQSEYAAVGQFSTTNTSSDPANFSGVGEANEMDNHVITGLRSLFSGSYSFSSASNGYGTLSVTSGLGSTKSLGIYATDPTLNLNDPNSATGEGGDLVLDLSLLTSGSLAGGTGVLIPQTDTATASFANNYVAGWQNFNTFTQCNSCEFDMLAQGSMTEGALNLTGDISDPFKTWSETTTASTGNNFYGSPDADTTYPGRYSMLSADSNPLHITPAGNEFATFDLVMYQANGGQLYWLDFDTSLPVSRVFLGSLEQQGDLSGVPMAKKPAVALPSSRKR